MSDSFHRLVHELGRLPGIGKKSATRMAYHLVGQPARVLQQLAEALVEAADNIRLCSICMDLTERETCSRCRDSSRDSSQICVVATPSDVDAIDRGGAFRGRYHVLHGLLSPLDGIGPEDLRIKELLHRATEQRDTEIILALSANVDGESTSLYLAKTLKPHGVTVTKIASGLPVGGELEYTDQATISRAIEGRVPL